jgi:hypothetical protein
VTLDRPRRIGEILREALTLYRLDWSTYLLVAALVIVPAELVVSGIGLGQLSAAYEAETMSELLVGLALQQLVTLPLATAMAIAVVVGRLRGDRVAPRVAVRSGLDVFARLLVAMLAVGAAVALGVIVFVLPGVYLAVRLIVTVPAVVVEERAPADALRRSWSLVAGSWWRSLGTVVVVNLVGLLATAPFVALMSAAADASDRQWPVLAGSIVGQVITVPLTAIAVTLLFGDLRARASAAGRHDRAAA